jgi:hypothetical protein
MRQNMGRELDMGRRAVKILRIWGTALLCPDKGASDGGAATSFGAGPIEN